MTTVGRDGQGRERRQEGKTSLDPEQGLRSLVITLQCLGALWRAGPAGSHGAGGAGEDRAGDSAPCVCASVCVCA